MVNYAYTKIQGDTGNQFLSYQSILIEFLDFIWHENPKSIYIKETLTRNVFVRSFNDKETTDIPLDMFNIIHKLRKMNKSKTLIT